MLLIREAMFLFVSVFLVQETVDPVPVFRPVDGLLAIRFMEAPLLLHILTHVSDIIRDKR